MIHQIFKTNNVDKKPGIWFRIFPANITYSGVLVAFSNGMQNFSFAVHSLSFALRAKSNF